MILLFATDASFPDRVCHAAQFSSETLASRYATKRSVSTQATTKRFLKDADVVHDERRDRRARKILPETKCVRLPTSPREGVELGDEAVIIELTDAGCGVS